jgi:hypothetical protein
MQGTSGAGNLESGAARPSVRHTPGKTADPRFRSAQGAGISGQDSCVTMQMMIGSFILFWIGYVLWMTWELKSTRDAELLHRATRQQFATQPVEG